MMKFLSLLWLVLSACPVLAALHELKSPPEFLAGDEAFKMRADETKAREALLLYKQQWERNQSGEAGWRYAMACQFVGLRLEKEKEQKLSVFSEGRDAGKKALERFPDCVACHFWTAVNMALYANTVGIFRTLMLLPEVRSHLQDVVANDPAYAYGSALRVLGIIERKVPGIFGGSDTRAREYFEKALVIAPDEPLNFLAYAEFLRDENDKAGLQILRERSQGIVQPAADRLESREAWQELRELLLVW